MIHRAVFGSVERFFAMFAEHCQGRWPFWVSPRQILIIPISEKHHDYAQNCLNKLKFENNLKLNIEIDLSSKKMERKIRDGQLIHFNYIIVVGNKEIEHDSINVRSYDGKILGEMKIIDFVNICKNRIENLD
jgi:threonyl-tRNA synthetase